MTPQTVRAILAYLLTLAACGSAGLIFLTPLNQFQAALLGTVLGIVLAKWGMTVAYFFDGIASPDTVTPAPAKPVPAVPAVTEEMFK